MSQRRNNRLQRRDERAARQPGNAQRPRRERSTATATQGPRGGLPMTTILIGIGVIGIVAVLVYAVIQAGADPGESPAEKAEAAELDDDPSLPGVYYPPHPGADGQPDTGDERLHQAPNVIIPICTEEQIAEGKLSDPGYGPAGVCYHSNPPTSGPHSSTPQGFTNLENPEGPESSVRKENLIHSMEHGGVIIWYNTSDQEAIDLIKSVVDENTDRRRFVASVNYSSMEEETIAITAWTRLDKFSVADLTRERLQAFIDAHHRRFNPEGF